MDNERTKERLWESGLKTRAKRLSNKASRWRLKDGPESAEKEMKRGFLHAPNNQPALLGPLWGLVGDSPPLASSLAPGSPNMGRACARLMFAGFNPLGARPEARIGTKSARASGRRAQIAEEL